MNVACYTEESFDWAGAWQGGIVCAKNLLHSGKVAEEVAQGVSIGIKISSQIILDLEISIGKSISIVVEAEE